MAVFDSLPTDQLLFDVAASARALGVGRTTLFQLIQSGELSTVTIGRRRLVPRSSLLAFVERLEREASQ
jgi:excisionase family DNA binding protein